MTGTCPSCKAPATTSEQGVWAAEAGSAGCERAPGEAPSEGAMTPNVASAVQGCMAPAKDAVAEE
eukprot:12877960-Alexandrium_andersonii.AAC.1